MLGVGFEPTKASPPDLKSGPFDHSGTPATLRKRTSFSTSRIISLNLHCYVHKTANRLMLYSYGYLLTGVVMSRSSYQSKALVLCLMFICSIFSTLIHFEASEDELMEIIPVMYSTSADQDYRFYFEALTQDDINSGMTGDGKITTREPSSGSQSKISIMDNAGVFMTPLLLSDINISGVSNEIDFNVFYQISGPDGATAEMDIILKKESH